MSKSKFLNYKLLTKSNIALLWILAMMAGFLVSHAVLSLTYVAFGLTTLWNINPKRWFQNKWWVLGAVWVGAYIISYYWSSDPEYWYHHSEIKMPVLLLPLVFSFLPSFSYRQLCIFTVATGCMLLAGACYSSCFLIGNLDYYMEQYRIAHVLPTPADGDYIRFSVSISLFIIWCFSFWADMQGKLLKWFAGVAIALLALYLHVLASKSGLITFYLFIISWAIYTAISKRKILPGLGIIASLVVFLLLAIRFIPTLHQRAGYISYTYIEYTRGDQSGTYGDISRLISYDVAAKVIKENPLKGVGAGDMLDEMSKSYSRWYPNIAEENRLLPHNQFLIVAVGCGVPVAIIFILWVFFPLTWIKWNKESFYFFIVWLVLLIQLMIEPVLEIENGVFVYLFFLLWQKHTLPQTKTARA